MTSDDAIRLAREAGFEVGRDAGGEYVAPQYSDSVGTLVRLVKAAYAAGQAYARENAQIELNDMKRKGGQLFAAYFDACANEAKAEAIEREACAKLCDQFAALMRIGKGGDQLTDQLLDLQAKTGDDLAATIRARAEKGGA